MSLWKKVKDYFFPFKADALLTFDRSMHAQEHKSAVSDIPFTLQGEFQVMNGFEDPSGLHTWELVIMVATRLQAEVGDFRRIDLVRGIQLLDPNRGDGTIGPIIQGMTIGAIGPVSSCGKPLLRVGRGLYRLVENRESPEYRSPKETTRVKAPTSNRRSIGQNDMQRRIESIIEEFTECVDFFDQEIPFTRSGQYSLHRQTIDMRSTFNSVHAALANDDFILSLHKTLYAWGIGKRASKILPVEQFSERLRSNAAAIAAFQDLDLSDENLDISGVAEELWRLIGSLGVVANVSLIVPGTKTLHHLLPNLVPPMDRAWTGAFFQWSTPSLKYERLAFIRTFSSFAEIAQMTNPSDFVGEKWRTSQTKILDNAIIGYCKLHEIQPRGA